MALSKDQIKAVSDRLLQPVAFFVPELEGEVLIKPLTLGQKAEWQATMQAANGKVDDVKVRTAHISLAASCIVDETGTRMFTAEEMRDMSAVSTDLLIREIQRLNGMGAAAVDEAEKN